jgi:hypothetical protein
VHHSVIFVIHVMIDKELSITTSAFVFFVKHLSYTSVMTRVDVIPTEAL